MAKFYVKYNKKYLFCSKYDCLNLPFGISNSDKRIIDTRLKSSIDYLKNSHISINGENVCTLFDVSMGANIQPHKFRSELWNRINTMKEFAKEKGFDTPVFITLTPPSYLKPLKQIKLGKSNSYKLVDNPKFCGCFDDYVSMSRDYLGNSWRKFLNQRIFKDIKDKYNQKCIYLKVYEPFIDGSCHSHIVAFIPGEFQDRFEKLVKGYFKTRTDVKSKFSDDVGGVVAYLLKYVLKSFKDSKSLELNDTSYWYIKNNIRRFSTSRTLIPLYYFQKIKHNKSFRNLKELTNLYKDGLISCDVIVNHKKVINNEKLLSSDYIIDCISISILDYEYQEQIIVYKKSDNVSIVFPDKEVGLNGEQAKIKSLVPLLKSFSKIKQEEDKNLFLASWKLKPFAHMTNYQLVTHYVQSFFWYTYPIKIASLENELLKRGFGYLTGEKEKHCLNLWNYRNLSNKFGNKGLIPLPF